MNRPGEDSEYHKPNEHGVFVRGQREEIVGHSANYNFYNRGWRVELMLAHAGPDDWRSWYSVKVAYESASGAPSLTGKKFSNRLDAYFDAIAGAERYLYERIVSSSDAQKAEIDGALRWLRDQRQLNFLAGLGG